MAAPDPKDTQTMDALKPGHYWKTPFIWQAGCPEPHAEPRLRFEEAGPAWLTDAVAQAMASSMDASDQYVVAQSDPLTAARDLLAMAPTHFSLPPGWWRMAVDDQGQRVGFVLVVQFSSAKRWRDGRPEATIFYMGVLPGHRGQGHGRRLLDEAVRLSQLANCWRLFCDTGTDNHPMVNAFRQAGFEERLPWQRPLA